MEITFTDSLTPDQQQAWIKFWEQSPHAHPRQHYAMGQIEIAKGRKPVFAFGRVDSEIVVMGIFSIQPLWFGDKCSLEAICYSGPVFEDPKHIYPFMEQVIDYFKKRYVGKVTISPYWLYPEAAPVKNELTTLGFSHGKPRPTGIVNLSCTEDELFMSFSKKVRKQIRKLEQFQFDIKITTAVEDAKPLYDSLSKMRFDKGIEQMSWPEFKETLLCLNKNPMLGLCALMNYEHSFLTGRFLLCGPETAHGLGYVVNRQTADLLPNITVGFTLFWWCFCWAQQHGYKFFDLEGYQENIKPDHPLYALYQYKRQFRPHQVYRLESFGYQCNFYVCLLLKGLKILDNTIRRLKSVLYCFKK